MAPHFLDIPSPQIPLLLVISHGICSVPLCGASPTQLLPVYQAVDRCYTPPAGDIPWHIACHFVAPHLLNFFVSIKLWTDAALESSCCSPSGLHQGVPCKIALSVAPGVCPAQALHPRPLLQDPSRLEALQNRCFIPTPKVDLLVVVQVRWLLHHACRYPYWCRMQRGNTQVAVLCYPFQPLSDQSTPGSMLVLWATLCDMPVGCWQLPWARVGR